MRIKNLLILLFVSMLFPLSSNAQDIDKETKAIFDSILKYFAEGRSYSDLNQKTIRLNITNNTDKIYLLYFFVCKEED